MNGAEASILFVCPSFFSSFFMPLLLFYSLYLFSPFVCLPISSLCGRASAPALVSEREWVYRCLSVFLSVCLSVYMCIDL